MSAGPFVTTNYESDTLPGNPIMIARVQPETSALILGGANNEPGGATVTLPLRVNIAGNRNELGVKPRTVTLKWNAAAPEGYSQSGRLVVPIFSKSLWDSIDPFVTTGTYLATAVEVISKTPEFSK
jgi:hypothetical protein